MIPPDLRQSIARFLPQDQPWDFEITIGTPHSYLSTFLALGDSWHPIGSSERGMVIIHPGFYEDTAAGLALMVHEAYHQWQIANIPALLERNAVEEQKRQLLRLPPYSNPFEYPAYLLECKVYRTLVAEGKEPGSFVPLGVQVGLC